MYWLFVIEDQVLYTKHTYIRTYNPHLYKFCTFYVAEQNTIQLFWSKFGIHLWYHEVSMMQRFNTLATANSLTLTMLNKLDDLTTTTTTTSKVLVRTSFDIGLT